MSEFLIITGLSGAGRSQAADTFEDLGWFVIDNMPPALIPKVTELVEAPGSTTERVALVVGTGAYLDEITPALDQLRKSASRVRILFLEATTEVLVRRYENTRRRHPLAEDERVSEGIERERELLDPIKAEADVVVDTSDLNVHQLRERLLDLFARDTEHGLTTSLVSFGYKHGLPLDVDLVFDCRFLPNPHWVESLRPLTGLDEKVREYVCSQPETGEFLQRLDGLLALLLPAYVKEGKSYLSIGVGCTGGTHRSVVIAEELKRMLERRGYSPTVSHRDVDKHLTEGRLPPKTAGGGL
ncbi:MAG TPA: RNase adapter RapZ [Acidimicrobiales bacterium]|nr:RNase adapter RapZ [Acidimicrobiales bacterium]